MDLYCERDQRTVASGIAQKGRKGARKRRIGGFTSYTPSSAWLSQSSGAGTSPMACKHKR